MVMLNGILCTFVLLFTAISGCVEETGEDCNALSPLVLGESALGTFPGNSVNVSISGKPPFAITVPPDPKIASAVITDSSVSPTTIVLSVLDTAAIGEGTSLTVVHACGETAHLFIQVTGWPTAISYTDDIQPIWDSNCQSRGCHPGGGAPFSLDRFVSWSNLWFAPVSNPNCGALYRVVGGINGGGGNPDSSLLYLVVSRKTICPRMPFTTDPADTLSQSDQEKIRVWILEGAQNN